MTHDAIRTSAIMALASTKQSRRSVISHGRRVSTRVDVRPSDRDDGIDANDGRTDVDESLIFVCTFVIMWVFCDRLSVQNVSLGSFV